MDFTALDVLTASEMDDLVENIEALADGSGQDSTAVLIQSNPYKFRAYRTSGHNFTNAFAKVPFDTESYDTNNNFTGGTYTAPVNGFYQFNARCSTSQSSGTHRLVIALYKNGAEASRGSDGSGTFYNGSVVSDTLQLTAGQTVEVYALADTTLAADVTVPSTTNFFSGHLVSRT